MADQAQPVVRVAGLPPGIAPGPLGVRFVAYLIDSVVPVFIALLGAMLVVQTDLSPSVVGIVASLLIGIWGLLVWWMFATRAAGPGMRLMHLQLVGLANGRPIGWGRFFVRQVILFALGLTGIGLLLLVIFLVQHPRRQGWHDLAVNSVVIKERQGTQTRQSQPRHAATAGPGASPVAPPRAPAASGHAGSPTAPSAVPMGAGSPAPLNPPLTPPPGYPAPARSAVEQRAPAQSNSPQSPVRRSPMQPGAAQSSPAPAAPPYQGAARPAGPGTPSVGSSPPQPVQPVQPLQPPQPVQPLQPPGVPAPQAWSSPGGARPAATQPTAVPPVPVPTAAPPVDGPSGAESAASGPSPDRPWPPPPAQAGQPVGQTVGSARAGGSSFATSGGASWRAVLDDGREIAVDGLVLLGRNPQARPGEEHATLIKIADTTRTVSKSHLELGRNTTGLYVVDRGSTNGSTITSVSGVSQRCAPGDPVQVEAGSIVSFGDHWLEVRRS